MCLSRSLCACSYEQKRFLWSNSVIAVNTLRCSSSNRTRRLGNFCSSVQSAEEAVLLRCPGLTRALVYCLLAGTLFYGLHLRKLKWPTALSALFFLSLFFPRVLLCACTCIIIRTNICHFFLLVRSWLIFIEIFFRHLDSYRRPIFVSRLYIGKVFPL